MTRHYVDADSDTLTFSITQLQLSGKIEPPTFREVKGTPSLFNADLEDALKYGGDLTRASLGAMDIRGDRRYVVVDTKVHMLMKGFMPAIPGWHTDAAPREKRADGSLGPPHIWPQLEAESPRFHLLVTGEHCLTRFLVKPTPLSVPCKPSSDLYRLITEQMHELEQHGGLSPDDYFDSPSCQVVEWDWWQLHTAVKSSGYEWRFLIRVTETDYEQPQTDLRNIIRLQQNVYVPMEYGW